MIGQSPQQSPLRYPHDNRIPKPIRFEENLEFLRHLSVDELRSRMANLDIEMEAKKKELHQRYRTERQRILEEIDNKMIRQQNL